MKYYLNGFPKSGLHLLDALLQPITQDGEADFMGTYMFGSWAFERAPLELLTSALTYLPDNHRLLGHACYDEDLDLFLYYSGIAHIFIYRDLRDVAVSQAHHILSNDDERFKHPGKDEYRALGGFENVLSAVWQGIDGYPGVGERWGHYATWLKSEHTLCLSYEDVINNLHGAAVTICKYGRKRLKEATGHWIGGISGSQTRDMVASARDTGKSPTFRKGQPGEWRQYADVFEMEVI